MTEKNAILEENGIIGNIGTPDSFQNLGKGMPVKHDVPLLKFLLEPDDAANAKWCF